MSQSVSVSRYIKTGTEVEAKYVDPETDDETRWYQGIVKKVLKYGEDDCGKYAECDVLYDDGEMVKGWRFYDEDYGDEVWRFSSSLAPLVDALLLRIKEVDEVKEAGTELEDEDDYDDTEDEDDEDDSDYEESDDEDIEFLKIEIRKEQKIDEILRKINRATTVQTVTAFAISILAMAFMVSHSQHNVCTVFW